MGDLFDYRHPPTRTGDPVTSFRAADAVAPITGKIRRQVYEYAVQRGSYGFTDDEMFMAFPGCGESSYRTRRSELVESGHIINSGLERVNRRGRDCVVWRIK